jgi:hypothetical protein
MNRKKLLPAQHTGKIRHHKHTSYGALALVLLLGLVPLVVASRSVALAAADPVAINNSVYAVVPGPTPSTAPIITNIPPGTVYTDNNPVVVLGTCPADTLVKIYKNDVFSAATLCQNGRFSTLIDLFLGSNTLIVRAFNTSNNVSPESTPIRVAKELAGINLSNVGQQFVITSDIYYRGVGVGEKLSWPITVTGGQAPYAVSIAWGDGKTDLISRGVPGMFDIQHIYDKPGNGYKNSYDVTITTTDSAGNRSFVHLVSIVTGGDPGIVGSIKQGYDWSTAIRISWQVMITVILLLLAFWLGERREMRLLRKRAGTA